MMTDYENAAKKYDSELAALKRELELARQASEYKFCIKIMTERDSLKSDLVEARNVQD